NRDLLFVLPGENAAFGENADFRYHRIRRGAKGHAGGNPPANEPVLVRVLFHLAAAAMGHLPRPLEQEQAIIGRRREDAATTGFLNERGEIDIWFKAKERQLEAILPACLAVAPTGIAAKLGENRRNLIREINRQRR